MEVPVERIQVVQLRVRRPPCDVLAEPADGFHGEHGAPEACQRHREPTGACTDVDDRTALQLAYLGEGLHGRPQLLHAVVGAGKALVHEPVGELPDEGAPVRGEVMGVVAGQIDDLGDPRRELRTTGFDEPPQASIRGQDRTERGHWGTNGQGQELETLEEQEVVDLQRKVSEPCLQARLVAHRGHRATSPRRSPPCS